MARSSMMELAENRNLARPEGIRFTFCREIPCSSRNSSSLTEMSSYEAFLPSSRNLNISEFIIQDRIIILKDGRRNGEFKRSESLKDTDLIAKMV